ncbi:MAG TPA: hypothetical protein VKZ56_04920 [Membranihabitans sp.]|nr:hypothetical protein [Membranihabitans sp.]
MKNKLPIGYYLKKVDNLLTSGIEKIHSANEINRLDWQIIHSLSIRKDMDRKNLSALLQEFADEETVNETLRVLMQRGYISQQNGNLRLTREGLRLHETCWQQQQDFRKKAMSNVSEQEYIQLISILERIIRNLEESYE